MSGARPEGRIRAVLDTNVYISAFNSTRGVAFDLWSRAVRHEYALVVSRDILTEVAKVLRRDFGWSDSEIVQQLKLVVHAAELVEPDRSLAVNIPADPDDGRIVECASAAKADLIVSADHHLTDLREYQGIRIVHPVDFRRALGH